MTLKEVKYMKIPERIVISKRIVLHKEEKIRHLCICKDGIFWYNLKFKIEYYRYNPKLWRLHIQIWLPFIHILRDNSKWEIGNKYRLYIYH